MEENFVYFVPFLSLFEACMRLQGRFRPLKTRAGVTRAGDPNWLGELLSHFGSARALEPFATAANPLKSCLRNFISILRANWRILEVH